MLPLRQVEVSDPDGRPGPSRQFHIISCGKGRKRYILFSEFIGAGEAARGMGLAGRSAIGRQNGVQPFVGWRCEVVRPAGLFRVLLLA